VILGAAEAAESVVQLLGERHDGAGNAETETGNADAETGNADGMCGEKTDRQTDRRTGKGDLE
jgi:hypothetical protein